jgi:hypothetical protein
VLAVCCGQTEKAYLDGLKRVVHPVTLKPVVKVGSPEQLVGYAAKLRDQGAGSYDEVWCVVDVDDFDIPKAVTAAAKAGISLAVSDPCFELWLLLHFADHRAHVKDAVAACALLAKHVPGYDKKLDYAAFDAGVVAAIGRAKVLKPGNPSTDVWRLVEVVLAR